MVLLTTTLPYYGVRSADPTHLLLLDSSQDNYSVRYRRKQRRKHSSKVFWVEKVEGPRAEIVHTCVLEVAEWSPFCKVDPMHGQREGRTEKMECYGGTDSYYSTRSWEGCKSSCHGVILLGNWKRFCQPSRTKRPPLSAGGYILGYHFFFRLFRRNAEHKHSILTDDISDVCYISTECSYHQAVPHKWSPRGNLWSFFEEGERITMQIDILPKLKKKRY